MKSEPMDLYEGLENPNEIDIDAGTGSVYEQYISKRESRLYIKQKDGGWKDVGIWKYESKPMDSDER